MRHESRQAPGYASQQRAIERYIDTIRRASQPARSEVVVATPIRVVDADVQSIDDAGFGLPWPEWTQRPDADRVAERIAFHEAGHAVAAVLAGLPIAEATLVAPTTGYGQVSLAKMEAPADEHLTGHVLRGMFMTRAGLAVDQQRGVPQGWKACLDGDLPNLNAYARRLVESSQAESLVREVTAVTVEVMHDAREPVRIVAEALRSEWTLSDGDLTALLVGKLRDLPWWADVQLSGLARRITGE